MLLAIMYHRIGEGKYANSLQMLRSHLTYLKQNYSVVLPGDPLPKKRLAICITFDDAGFDFYHFIFPLLKELNMRALLGVPARYILDSTSLTPEVRLSVPFTMAMQDGFFDEKVPFCTWKELDEMVQSGLVEIASHSYMHPNLTFGFVDLNREVVVSKQIIETKLSQPVSSFIYPFGKVNHRVHEFVAKHYPYAFRIGSALNWGWGTGSKPLSRISGDRLLSPAAPFSYGNLLKYTLKGLLA